MKKNDFLFEIGTEEIPAGYIGSAVNKLKDSFIKDLNELKLEYQDIFVYSTPRRLAIKIIGMDSTQKNETIEKIGPSKKASHDENGNLTKAGDGFLKSVGGKEEEIYFIETSKGEYIAIKIFLEGKATMTLLPQMMKNAIEKIAFPKTMKWGSGTVMFARPIRWIVALADDKILNFEYEGVVAGRKSYGNRYVGLDSHIKVLNVNQYPEILKEVKVLAHREHRRESIKSQIIEYSTHKQRPISGIDEKLLDIVTDLVEYPTAVKASFSRKYLDLPSKIITSTLSQNQKYFTKLDKDGNLDNEFYFVSNGDPAFSETIKIGNEKVVKARLDDAQFYFYEDTKKSLEQYVEKLDEVVFHAQLGTMLEKTERIVAMCNHLSDILFTPNKLFPKNNNENDLLISTNEQKKEDVLRAARLSKADLVTLMLSEKEFTALQGYIGMNYAMISGEKHEVAKAIYEHYMPRGHQDDLPSETIGAVLAVADKLDTICGIIGVGLLPTGSADPFAIRRAANGIVQIIDKYNFDFSLKCLIEKSFSYLAQKVDLKESLARTTQIVFVFFRQRIKWLLEEFYHIEYDVIEALDIFEWDKLIDIKNRAIALQDFKSQAMSQHSAIDTEVSTNFRILVLGFKRVSNILEKNDTDFTLNPAYLKDKSELILYHNMQNIQSEIKPLVSEMKYREALEKIVTLGTDIDIFFDKVLVMTDDVCLKNNRLALLKEIRMMFLKIADISKINFEG